MFKLQFFILALFTCTLLNAQEDVDGAMLQANQSILVEDIGFANMGAMTAAQNVKSFLMPPRDYRERSMSAFYAACSVAEYYVNLESNYKVNLSPDYVYLNLLKNDASIADILSFLKETGTVSAAIMPYGSEKISNSVHSVEKYSIGGHVHLFRKENKPRSRVFEARAALMRGNPIIVKMKIRRNFVELQESQMLWDANKGNTDDAGTHTVLVVGYDDNSDTFELMNSWGFRWGNRGCVNISYDDFGDMAIEGLVVLPKRD